MRTVSLIVRKEPPEQISNSVAFLKYVKSINPDRIFLSITDESGSNPGLGVVSSLSSDSDLGNRVRDVSVTLGSYTKAESDFGSSISSDANLIAKKKMLDMFTATIYSYLQGTWKDFDSLNSKDSNSIFKARYLLISSILPEYLSGYFLPLLHSVREKIMEAVPGPDDIVVSDVEWAFWFRDNII